MSDIKEIPESIFEAFPILKKGTLLERLASEVPLVPDTTFDIYDYGDGKLFALTITDYANPSFQSIELKNISSKYEFSSLIKPYRQDDGLIVIKQNDEIDNDFFVTAPYMNYQLYYYVANIKVI